MTAASVEEVKERADLLELARADTELRKAGVEWVGRCPFHQERSGSFYVNPVKKLYHCHGCGVGGDAIAYVRARHALDFTSAIEWLAERFNVALSYEEESPEVAARRRGEDRRRELLALTASFYHRVLRESPLAAGARAYLNERGVTWEMAERFQLGYSADEHQVIAGAHKRGFADRELDETGITRRGRGGPADRMTGRLVFTLFDRRGRPIAFAGRRLPPDETGAKYVNSPESPLWHKGSTLYGLHLARTAIARGEEAIVVEGYTDVIMLAQAGYDNVIASMGTSLTQPQLRELRSLARNVVLLFDADAAGGEAAMRGIDLATSSEIGLHVRIASPPRGSDPADVAATGRDAIERLLNDAQSVLAFRVSRALGAADAGTAIGRDEAYAALREIFKGAPATPERDELVRLAGSRLFLDPLMEARLVSRGTRRRASAPGVEGRVRLPMDATQRDERILLALVLDTGERALPVLERIPPEALVQEDMRTAHAWVKARLNQIDPPSVSHVERLEAEFAALAARHRGPEALAEVAGRVESSWIKRRLEPLKEKLAAAEITPVELRELAELQALARSAGGQYVPRTSRT
ncbi:MAG: primase [Gaiellales bacterium]|jgi:DNA primase|nr:primase [Gaiellales bacterium]